MARMQRSLKTVSFATKEITPTRQIAVTIVMQVTTTIQPIRHTQLLSSLPTVNPATQNRFGRHLLSTTMDSIFPFTVVNIAENGIPVPTAIPNLLILLFFPA